MGHWVKVIKILLLLRLLLVRNTIKWHHLLGHWDTLTLLLVVDSMEWPWHKNPQLDYQLFQKTNQNFKDLHLDWDNEAKDQFSANNKILFSLCIVILKRLTQQHMKDEKNC